MMMMMMMMWDSANVHAVNDHNNTTLSDMILVHIHKYISYHTMMFLAEYRLQG